MAGQKKRAFDAKQQRPSKKQKRQQQYHSDSESDGGNENDEQNFDAVNLLDSDDDIHNATVDSVVAQDSSENDISSSEDERPALTKKTKKIETKPAKRASKPAAVSKKNKQEEEEKEDDEEEEEEEDDDDDDDEDDDENDDDEDDDEEDDVDEYDLDSDNGDNGRHKTKSKRNDPNAFATSISKILSTKLSTSKRADPVLSRSAAAHEASKAAVDDVLEAKAKRHMKEQKKKALEKGRIREVLVASRDEFDIGAPEDSTAMTTTHILETERRLRKVAQRGVVKLFNAVRAAQVKAVEAEKDARREGVIGMNNREAKVNELSKKGFLDLIASGGGGLKKGGLEEA
ncbi:hypothetical protein E4U32_007161 [Claviceps aff. humidiphila group G2b]|nr:hypothetical protein E4U32_007161 [Claviceps aff. humidiphila group G2b]